MASAASRPHRGHVPAGFLYRGVDDDTALVETAPRALLKGLVLSTRSVASSSEGRILQAARTRKVPFLVDPDTAALVEVTPDHPRAQWLQAMPAGAFVESPPISPRDLDDQASCEVFNRAVLSAQSGAVALSAGYFRVSERNDPWREVNQRLIEASKRTAAGRPLCAWLEVPMAAAADGLIAELADDYRDAEYVVLRIATLHTDRARKEEALVALKAVATLAARRPRVIFDSATAVGAAACAAGAHAFTSGGNHHRSVPRVRIHRGQPSTPALGYEIPLEFRQLATEHALELRELDALESCGVEGCRALDPSLPKRRRPRAMREHFIHACQINSTFATIHPPLRVAEELCASQDPASRAWGEALREIAASDSVRIHSPR